MKEFKGTKSKVSVKYIKSEKWFNIGISKMYRVARTFVMSGISEETARHNANLIADTFNTTNECGMLPSELLESNRELLEALEVLYKHTKQWTDQGSYSEQEAFELELNQAQQAIKNAKG